MRSLLSIGFILTLFLFSCTKSTVHESYNPEPNPYASQLSDYWYSGKAEITSYKLNQARYGEMRDGHAVMVFVTEDFSTETNTKADEPSPDNVSVLKLNATRNFLTGVYPYSLMTSTFFPFDGGVNALKISTSVQEWCGHTYLELLNDKGRFTLYNASYFQKESQRELTLDMTLLEDDLWSQIRLNPDALPSGECEMIPSFMYLRFSHIEIKPYRATIKTVEAEDGQTLIAEYPELDRELKIIFNERISF